MSRVKRGGKSETSDASRPIPRRDSARPRDLRVIPGGSGRRPASARDSGKAKTRRSLPPSRVKRRRRITLAVLLLLAAGLITYILLGPVTRLVESQRNLTQAEAQLDEEQSRTHALEERKAWDMTDRFVELEAREMGYVKPGEIPIVVLDHEEEEPAVENPPDDPSP